MKTKKIVLSIQPTKEALHSFASTLKSARRGKIKKHSGVSFESIEGLRKVLTKARLELISTIKHKNPESIYHLSKMVNRNLKSVNTDLKILEENDFIRLKKIKDGRARSVPKVLFNDIKITVQV